MKSKKIELVVSRDILDYSDILEGLVDVFGLDFYPSILAWCRIIKTNPISLNNWRRKWIIKSKNKSIGTCGLYSLSEDVNELWLAWFGLLPLFRNKGLGKEALELMEQYAKEFGASSIWVYVDKAGTPLPFYYRSGYCKVSSVKDYLDKHPDVNEEHFQNAEDHVLMKKLQS